MRHYSLARFIVFSYQLRIVLGITFWFASSALKAADVANTSSPSSQSASADESWVTSMAVLASDNAAESDIVFGRATGLLLRPGTVSRWRAGQPETLYEHPAAVWAVDATADGQTIVSGDYRGNLITYDVATQKATTHENAFERWCQAIFMSPDDESVLAGNESGKLFVWNLGEAKVSKSLELGKASITCIASSPDQQQLAVSDGTGTIHLLAWPTFETLGTIKISDDTAWCVAYADNKTLLVGSADRNLYRVAAMPDAQPKSIAKGTDWVTRIAVSTSGQIVASQVSGKVHFLDGSKVTTIDASSGVWSLCFKTPSELLVGTRKNGIAMAGQSWAWKSIDQAGVEAEVSEPDKPGSEGSNQGEP